MMLMKTVRSQSDPSGFEYYIRLLSEVSDSERKGKVEIPNRITWVYGVYIYVSKCTQ